MNHRPDNQAVAVSGAAPELQAAREWLQSTLHLPPESSQKHRAVLLAATAAGELPGQEAVPVAWMYRTDGSKPIASYEPRVSLTRWKPGNHDWQETPLYASPPPAPMPPEVARVLQEMRDDASEAGAFKQALLHWAAQIEAAWRGKS